MGTIMQTVSSLCWRNCLPSQEKLHSKTQNVEFGGVINRREAVASGIALLSSAAAFGFPGDGLAVVKQGLLAGRIPGLSEPDEQGYSLNINIKRLLFGTGFHVVLVLF